MGCVKMGEPIYKLSEAKIDARLVEVRADLESQGLKTEFIDNTIQTIKEDLSGYSYVTGPMSGVTLTEHGFKKLIEDRAIEGLIKKYFTENPTPMQAALADQKTRYEAWIADKDMNSNFVIVFIA